MLRNDGAFVYSPMTGFTGTDSFSYLATDGTESTREALVTINVLPPGAERGSITREVWYDIPGLSPDDLIADPDYPDNPDLEETLDRFDGPHNQLNEYGQRIHGYLHPPTNGSYTFWITSAAKSKLFLSTDDNPDNATEICQCSVSLSGEYENWTNSANQQSVPIALTGGQRYYIMALHNEGNIDHVSVAWDLTPGSINIIEGAYLSPMPQAIPPVASYDDWSSWYGVSGDGYLLDFAFNLDPTLGSYPTLVPTSGTTGLPYWEISDIDGLEVEYLRRKDAPGTTYSVQFTDNLQSNWIDSAATETVSPMNATWERVMVEDDVDTANATNRFGRVIIIQE